MGVDMFLIVGFLPPAPRGERLRDPSEMVGFERWGPLHAESVCVRGRGYFRVDMSLSAEFLPPPPRGERLRDPSEMVGFESWGPLHAETVWEALFWS